MAREDDPDTTARLILVYNADGGVLNALKDAAHKIARPATYPCSLCALTYGWVAMHSDWRRFLFRLPLVKVFLHRDEAAKKGLAEEWPAVLLDAGQGAPEVLVPASELNAMQHRSELMALLLERLKDTGIVAR